MKFRHRALWLRLCIFACLCLGLAHRAVADAVPAAPSNAALYTYPSPTSIEVDWTDNSTDENSFTIQRKIDGQPDSSYLAVGSTFSTNVQGTGERVYFTDSGLALDTVYDYRVEAVAADGTVSGFSNTATGTTGPTTPTNLTAAAVAGTDNSIKLTWTDSAVHSQYFEVYRSTDGKSFSYINEVYYNGETNATFDPGKGNTQGYTDTGLNSATTYYYEVTAGNGAGETAKSAPASATTNAAVTVPAAPSVNGSAGSYGVNGTANPGTTNLVRVYDQSTNETGFTLERADPDDSVPFAPITTFPSAFGTGTSYPYYDLNLNVDTEYDYEAYATNAIGNSALSNVIKLYTIPVPPSGLTAAAVAGTDNSIKLTWTDNARHSQYFEVYRSTDGKSFSYINEVYYNGETNATFDPGKGNTQGYTDTGLNSATTYYYEVTAGNGAGETAKSAPASATTNAAVTVPAAPSVNGSAGSYGVNGTANPGTTNLVRVYDQSTNETGFTLERADPDDSVPFASVATFPAAVGTGTSYPYYDLNLNVDTEYDYEAFATNGAGNSLDSNVIKLYTIPVPPSGLTAAAVAGTDNSIKLTWTDNARHSQYFEVYRSTDGKSFSYINEVYYNGETNATFDPGKGNTQGYTDTGLNSATTYYYEVTAGNGAGETAKSAPASATTNAAVTVPAAPSVNGSAGSYGVNGTANPGTTNLVRVYDQSTNETGFTLERADPDDSVPFAPITTFPSAFGTGTSYPYYDLNLNVDTEYDYEAYATNAIGNSALSNVIKLYTIPVPPIGLTATALDSSDIRLTWTDNARHSQYFEVYRSTDGKSFSYINEVYYNGETNATFDPGKGNTEGYLDTNLSVNTTYYYEVTAGNGAGETAKSAPASATTLPNAAPGAPTGLQGTATTGPLQVDLNWTDNSNDEYGFNVEREDNDDPTSVFTVLGTPPTVGPQPGQGELVYYADKSVAADTQYTYEVNAENPVGASAFTNTVTVVTAPTTPSGFSGQPDPKHSTQTILTWANTAKHEAGFAVYREAPGQTTFTLAGNAPAPTGTNQTVTFTDSGLTVNTTYQYYVTAFNAGGASAPTATISVTTIPNDTVPPSTTLLTGPGVGATICTGSTTFTYTGLDNVTPTGLLQYETQLDGGAWSAPSLSTTTTLTGLSNGPHTFAVRAVDQAGNVDPKPPTQSFTVDTALPVISNLSSGTPGQTTATITWTTDRATTSTVQYRVQGTTTWTTVNNAALVTAHSVALSGLSQKTTYEYQVQSADSCQTATSAIQTFTTTADTTPPTTSITSGPANGATVCGSSVTFTVTATDPDNATSTLLYKYKLDGAAYTALSAATTISLTGLSDGTHTLTIAAVDPAGNVDPNPPTVSFVISTAPPALSAVTAAASGTGATITWTTDKAATSQVQYRVQGTTAWTTTTLDSTLVTAHSVTLSGLTLGTTYEYQVLSADSCGDTSTSPTATFSSANPAPAITSLSPISATAGGAAFTLTLTGTGFLPGVSAVTFGGLPETLLAGASATQLQITVPATAIAAVGNPAVVVTNPAPGGGTATVAFPVIAPLQHVPPTVTLTSPADGTTLTAPASLTLTATASESEGTVTQVQFFQNGTSVGIVTTAPYTVPLTGLATGTYVFKAVATDSTGASTTSATATVTVNNPAPGVTILTGPANNAIVCSTDVAFTWIGYLPGATAPLQYETQTDGGAWSAPTTATEQSLTGLAAGLHSFAVELLNPDGSVYGSPVGVSFYVDLTPPTLLTSGVTALLDTHATIGWSTSKPTTGYIEYGTSVGYGQQSATDTTSNGAHSIELTGLTTQTTYHYRIHYGDTCSNEVSPDMTFTTLPLQYPTLEVSGATVPPSFAPLQSINLSWTVLNAGPGDAIDNWTDTVYLSTKNTLDVTATKLGDYSSVQPLYALDSYTQNVTATIPRVPAGSYYLIIQANSTNVQPETTTADNTLAVPVTITALQNLVVTPDQTAITLHIGQTVTGTLNLTNLNLTAETGLTATVTGAPGNITIHATPPTALNSLQTGTVNYTVVASNASTQTASPQIVLTSADGSTATATLNLTVVPPTPQLTVVPTSLVSSMVRGGATRLVDFTVTNTGDATAKGLVLTLPNVPWLTLPSDNATGDLAPGASAQLELQLNPAPGLPLGLYTGTIALNGSNAGLSIPFSFNCISSAVGDLKVVAQDEFSFFSPTHPNLAGATVVLTDATTGVVVVNGVTGADGTLTESNIPEGNYNVVVTAPGHSEYQGTLQLLAGETNEIDPFLSAQLVTYTWNVVPIPLTDDYTITLDATFETHVPAPVITVDPALLDLTKIKFDSTGKAVVNYTVTNNGLIAGQNTQFAVPQATGFQFSAPVTAIGTVPPLTSVIVPVTITQAKASQFAKPLASSGGCTATGTVTYEYICGGINNRCDTFTVITNLCSGTGATQAPAQAASAANTAIEDQSYEELLQDIKATEMHDGLYGLVCTATGNCQAH